MNRAIPMSHVSRAIPKNRRSYRSYQRPKKALELSAITASALTATNATNMFFLNVICLCLP
jgi:hypothetical protein